MHQYSNIQYEYNIQAKIDSKATLTSDLLNYLRIMRKESIIIKEEI